jgi:glyoxylase-like metal-dependent hydrolase (beta-lactamase superfamily II)
MKTLSFLFIAFASFLASANELPDYKAEKIAANTYVIHGPLEFPNVKNQGFMNNPAFVITKTGVVVVDPGSSLYSGRMLLRQIRKVTSKPVTHVLNTHIHGDHWLGNHAIEETFPNALIMAHSKMISAAKAGAADQWLALMLSSTNGATKGTKAVIPSKAMNDASQFTTGGVTFVILAPGKAHSGTDIMIHVVEESVVFLGDNVLAKRLPRLDDATFRGSIKACDVAINIAAKHYVPGHGLSGSVSLVKTYKDYLSSVYSQAAEYYEEGLSDFEMKPKIVKNIAFYHNWANFDDEVGKHISLAVLEAEAAAFE